MTTIYADNAATTQMSRAAIDAMLPYLETIYGNPSSLHSVGQQAAGALLSARDRIAKCLNASPREIYFTSGGSEADNQAILSAARLGERKGKKHIISTAFEHHAVLHTLQKLEKEGFEVALLPVGPIGTVTAQQVERTIREDTCLVSVMYANNEIGSILPIAEIGAVCREKGVLFHTDAVQAAGHLHINVKEQNIDMLSLSGHKFRGPRGTGVLYVKKGITLEPLVYGGGQERGMRPGTEAVPNIAAFAKACEIRMAHFDEDYAHVQELADYLKQQVSAELVKPDENHDFSLLSVILAAGETDKSVLKKLKKLSDERKYQSGKHGWSSIRLAVVDLDTHKVHTNRMGDSLKNILQPLV